MRKPNFMHQLDFIQNLYGLIIKVINSINYVSAGLARTKLNQVLCKDNVIITLEKNTRILYLYLLYNLVLFWKTPFGFLCNDLYF